MSLFRLESEFRHHSLNSVARLNHSLNTHTFRSSLDFVPVWRVSKKESAPHHQRNEQAATLTSAEVLVTSIENLRAALARSSTTTARVGFIFAAVSEKGYHLQERKPRNAAVGVSVGLPGAVAMQEEKKSRLRSSWGFILQREI